MFRRYALFSIKHPNWHRFNLTAAILLMLICSYQLVENESLLFANGIAMSFILIVIFSRAADYRKKFLSHK